MPTKKKAAAKKATKKGVKKRPQKTTAKTTTKKTAKKAPVKKTSTNTTKKTTAQRSPAKKAEVGERVLVCARGKNCFWTNDGQVLKDLVELRDALAAMNETVFGYHVTSDKNDFADWVESVLEDAACAAALRKSRKSNTARTVVVRHLRYYSV